jgi:hypothetical protein
MRVAANGPSPSCSLESLYVRCASSHTPTPVHPQTHTSCKQAHGCPGSQAAHHRARIAQGFHMFRQDLPACAVTSKPPALPGYTSKPPGSQAAVVLQSGRTSQHVHGWAMRGHHRQASSARPPEASQEQRLERAAGRAAVVAQARAQPGLAAAAQERAQVAARLGAQRVLQAAQVDLRARGRFRRLAPSRQLRLGGRHRLRSWYIFLAREESQPPRHALCMQAGSQGSLDGRRVRQGAQRVRIDALSPHPAVP